MAKQIAQAPAEKMKKTTPKRLGKRKDIHWQLWLMMVPAIVYMVLFVYKPMGGVPSSRRMKSPSMGKLS